jgi:hypothetical protein
MSYFSNALTVTTVPQNLLANKPTISKVKQIAVKVRDMGTASYIAIGGVDTQDRRITAVGDGMSITPEQAGGEDIHYIDINSIRVVSDTSDAVLEIFGEAESS